MRTINNRPLKFRFWCPSSKKMVYSGYTEDICNSSNWIIMEYTGCHDHNNKEIYEGDIIDLTFSYGHERDSSHDYYGEYAVQFKNGEWRLIRICVYDENDYNNELSLWSESSDYKKKMGMEHFELVGNIFENVKIIQHETCK